MSLPLIGITCELLPHESLSEKDEHTLRRVYTDAVLAAGGLPVIIPVMAEGGALEELLSRLDGILLTGGDDIPPGRYGQTPHPTVKVMPEVQCENWLATMRFAVDRQRPTLGICAGLQVMNVALGGTLIQDVPSQVGEAVEHRRRAERDGVHEVQLDTETRLAGIVGAGALVTNSAHHQALDRVAEGLRVTARCGADGVIEAAELSSHPFCLGVQWHPERTPQDPATRRLFAAFIEAARANAETRKRGNAETG